LFGGFDLGHDALESLGPMQNRAVAAPVLLVGSELRRAAIPC
jgi:hypothetical protein